MTDSTVVLRFAGTRCAEGEDVAALLREGLGDELDLTAELDDSGALSAYVVTLDFTDSDRAADAAFRLRDLCLELGFRPEIK